MNFRPADEIFDDAITALTNKNGKDIPPDTRLSRHDLVKFMSLKCVASATKHLCEVKSTVLHLSASSIIYVA